MTAPAAGTPGETPTGVAVVGGGVAGLAAAHRVLELARARGERAALTLIEAGARLGGTIASERTQGFLIEAGADSFLTEKPWALALCRRLGLESELIGTRDEWRRTFVVHGGKLHVLPQGFLLLAPTAIWPVLTSSLFSWRGKLRMACDLVLPRGAPAADESLASFVTRRFGREVLERVAQPLVGGIYTADATRLSLAATMPRFLELERRHRSVIVGMRRQAPAAAKVDGGAAHAAAARGGAAAGSGARWSLFASFAEGMETLVRALARRLPEGAARLNTRVLAIERSARGAWRLVLEDGHAIEAERVILATPAFVTAELVRPLDPVIAAELAAIPYASSATVTLAYERALVPHALDGFGFVVPAIEGRTLIACSFASVKYAGRAPEGMALLRVFCGGALAEAMATLPEDELVAAARRELGELLGITAAPRLVRVHRHARAMPQYHVGHLERVRAIDARVAALRGLALAGNAYRGVGVPDCVHGGEAAAEAVLGVGELDVAGRPA